MWWNSFPGLREWCLSVHLLLYWYAPKLIPLHWPQHRNNMLFPVLPAPPVSCSWTAPVYSPLSIKHMEKNTTLRIWSEKQKVIIWTQKSVTKSGESLLILSPKLDWQFAVRIWSENMSKNLDLSEIRKASSISRSLMDPWEEGLNSCLPEGI